MNMNPQSLELLLKSLKLPHVATRWEQLETQATDSGWSYGQYLKAVCEHEQLQRDSRRLSRYLKESKLPVGKSLMGFDFAACTGLDKRTITQLASNLDWVRRGENVLIFGPSGVGKTHLAAALGLAAIERGMVVRYASATALVQQLQQAKVQLVLERQLIRLDRCLMLIVDDIGYVKRSEAETSVLFELIAHRYERLSLVITSNHPFREWDQIFTDTTMTVAAIDRLVHHATIIEISAESYRRKSAQQRQSASPTSEKPDEVRQ
jgi:DNA replication protein DnaC